ncbi:hypothetical protein V8E54_001604 [Elaphomyces granulatus]
MGKKRELTQDEIWDDSALVRSWDEAVEEYKLYHSIHAKGENVEEILQAAEAAERTVDGQVDDVESMQTNIVEAEVAGDEADRESHGAKGKRQADEPEVAPSTAKPPLETENVGGATWTIPGRMNIPEVQDEGLKNLMMAWYFAGYYTGLYEGQRQARQTTGS